MKQTIIINDKLLENASKCVGIEDVNEVIELALRELIAKHKTSFPKRRQPPVTIANKGKILGDIIAPSVDVDPNDFQRLLLESPEMANEEFQAIEEKRKHFNRQV
jgi:hypothetical protein